jgi:hypothetical protein
MTGDTFPHPTGDVTVALIPFRFIGDYMEKPHIPTIAELEALFAADDAPMVYRAPPNPERIKTAVRAFISAWDDDLTVRELAPFVEEVRRALEGRP